MTAIIGTTATPARDRRNRAGLPSEQHCTVLQAADGDAMALVLDRHLTHGYDLERAADGWVLLRRGSRRVAITTFGGRHMSGPETYEPVWPRTC